MLTFLDSHPSYVAALLHHDDLRREAEAARLAVQARPQRRLDRRADLRPWWGRLRPAAVPQLQPCC